METATLKETKVQIPNEEIKVKLIDLARNTSGTYDREELKKVLGMVPWTRISIPVYSYRNLVVEGQPDKRGHVIIGYITDYNTAAEEFTVCIYGRFAGSIKNFKDAIVYPRIVTDKEKGIVITALDVTPKGLHSKLFKMEKLGGAYSDKQGAGKRTNGKNDRGGFSKGRR